MNDRLPWLVLGLTILGLGAWIFFFLFEIVEDEKRIPPSREAQANDYLALDRWLEHMGISVRTENFGNLSVISRARERQIFVQSSLFRWTDPKSQLTDEAVEYLVRWIEEGGHLFLSLDSFADWHDDDSLPLLERFGIKPEMGTVSQDYDPESPSYDRWVYFEISQTEESLLLKDRGDNIKLAQLKRGKGKLTVTGRPLFLHSRRIDSAPNSRLAWVLFAGDFGANFPPGNQGGWLFVRGTTRAREGILGSLFKQGNLAVLLVSVLVLLVVGFWAVIPGFGLVRGDDERPGKPLRERFLAEGRFLKRYGALETYRDIYVKEIKRRLARKEGLSSDEEIEKRVLDIWGRPSDRGLAVREPENRMIVRIFRREPFRYREFPGMIIILKTILERI